MSSEKFNDNDVVELLCGRLSGRVDSFEIYISTAKGLTVEAKDGVVDSYKVWSDGGVGLRIIKDSRPGTAFTSLFDRASLEELANVATGAQEGADPDENLIFPEPGRPEAKKLDLFDPSVENTPEEEKIALALRIEESARAFDKRIRSIRSATYRERTVRTRVVNSRGVDCTHSATFSTGSVMAVAVEDEASEVGFEMGMGHRMADVDPEAIGTGAARRAVGMLGARGIKTVRCPAVFENLVACELLETLASSFLADNLHKGKSMLMGKRDKVVASKVLSLYDDGLMPRGWASSLFDAEGVPRQRTPLITEGVCRGFLYDTYWAGREGCASTGNSSRSGYRNPPTVGCSNIYFEKGEKSLDELLSDMGDGLFITEIMGAHTINRVSGDFSLGAAGFRVEGGSPVYPVRGIAISGNLLELLKRVEAVGGDLRFFGSVGSPSLLVGGIDASGA